MDVFFQIFDDFPVAIFIVDSDVKVLNANKQAKELFEGNTILFHKRGGELLKCINSFENELGCGHGTQCKSCVLRNSVNLAVEGNKTHRKQAVLKLKRDGHETVHHTLITTSPFEYEGTQNFILMIENINELIQLKEIIPICANCKKIRNDENFWMTVENYFHEHTDVDFSHSICPECMDILYPEIKDIREEKRKMLNE